MSRTHGHEAPDVFLGPTVGWGRDAPSSSRTISVPRCHDANADLTMTTVGLLQPPTRLTRIIHSFIHSSFITPTGSHIQIYSEVQLYNKLYLYTIGLQTDKHIMQEHIKGPYSEILQKHKNNTTEEEKPKNIYI